VAEAVVDLLEAVHIADHNHQGRGVALAAGQLAIKLQEQRAGVGQSRKVVSDCRTFGLLVLDGIFDGQRHLGTDGQQDAQVVRRESIAVRVVQGQNSDHSRQTFQRDRHPRAHRAELGRVV
jgi:hypothetical protein